MKESLYRIIVLHGGPKDSHKSTETYLVVNNEQEVFDWINKNKTYGLWTNGIEDEDEDGFCDYEPNVRYDEDGDEIPFTEWVMRNCGDLEDEEGWEDAYYGVTKWGWEYIDANPEEIAVLLKLGIAVLSDL